MKSKGRRRGLSRAWRLGLADALELTLLIARKDPRRHPRVAARWLLRYLEEHAAATIEEAGIVAACLQALGSPDHAEVVGVLRGMAERASGRSRFEA